MVTRLLQVEPTTGKVFESVDAVYSIIKISPRLSKQQLAKFGSFLPRDGMNERGFYRHAVSFCLFVCLSVRLSRS